jgi:hypothetical protein
MLDCCKGIMGISERPRRVPFKRKYPSKVIGYRGFIVNDQDVQVRHQAYSFTLSLRPA